MCEHELFENIVNNIIILILNVDYFTIDQIFLLVGVMGKINPLIEIKVTF